LWRAEDSHDPDVYQFERLVFGINASPFLAQYVSQTNARKYESRYKMAAESIIKSTYMDDTMDSVETEEQGRQLYRELSELWRLAGMNARKWMSNSIAVLDQIPQAERAYEVDLSKSEIPLIETLGLCWKSDTDEFTYCHLEAKQGEKITKRTVLKTVAALFDPLGFLIPFTVRAKMIMQKIWLTALDWDQELPETIVCEIRQWYSELRDLSKITVNRCINVTKEVKSTRLLMLNPRHMVQ
jgi:hypothetical protein